MTDLNAFVDRYLAVWHEPDPGRRRLKIANLWTPEGANITRSLEARGYEALEARIQKAYENWVIAEGCIFRSMSNADGHQGVVRFNWEMIPAGGGKVISVGFDFCLLETDGRIRDDFQFIER